MVEELVAYSTMVVILCFKLGTEITTLALLLRLLVGMCSSGQVPIPAPV